MLKGKTSTIFLLPPSDRPTPWHYTETTTAQEKQKVAAYSVFIYIGSGSRGAYRLSVC